MRNFYDALGEGEWSRLEDSINGRVAYEVHRQFLERFIAGGDHVLEVGAGPGRYTFDLARLGASVDVTDFSPVQLELHRQHVSRTAVEAAVKSRELLDICDTSRYAGKTFDVVLAYGGPLSYAFEKTQEAFDGLLRITKPGGYVVASVMSLLGTWRFALPGVLAIAKNQGEDANDAVLTTGDLRNLDAAHVCQMFRASDIQKLVAQSGAELVAMSASNWASLGDSDALIELEADPDRWARFIRNEVAACGEPGALDGGTHIMFGVRKP
jgi:SAM-dependent methyltransferase